MPNPTRSVAIYEVRPRDDRRGVDLISDALPFGRLWYSGSEATTNAVGYAKRFSRHQDCLIRVFDESGKLLDAHECLRTTNDQ